MGTEGLVVEARVVESAGAVRASISCKGEGAMASFDPALSLYGTRPIEGRFVASVPRKDGTATCTSGTAPLLTRAAFRVRPIVIRAVAPTVVREGRDARLVLTIDGQGLGPRVAADDGVYVVARGSIVAATTSCPEARYTDDRIVACAAATALVGLGPARVRVQSAGRLEEAAGAPIDLSVLMAPKAAAK